MSLINIDRTIELDVYDHDTTPSVIKTIQMDESTRTVFAMIQNARQNYDIGQNASVSLTVLRPDKTKVQITGQTFSYNGTDGTMYGAKADLSDVALAVKGNLKAQFKFTSGEQELRTEIFTINNGEALDAYDGDWAGDLDGHNLDEMAQDIEDTKAAVSEMETDVSELKEDLSFGLRGAITNLDNGKIAIASTFVFGTLDQSGNITSYPRNTRSTSVEYYTAKSGDVLTLDTGYAMIMCEYDASKTLVSRGVKNPGSYSLTEGHLYRITLYISGDLTIIGSPYDIAWSAHLPSNIDARINAVSADIAQTKEQLVIDSSVPSTTYNSGYVNATTDSISPMSATSEYFYSDIIDVSKGETVVVKYGESTNYVWVLSEWDSTGNFVRGIKKGIKSTDALLTYAFTATEDTRVRYSGRFETSKSIVISSVNDLNATILESAIDPNVPKNFLAMYDSITCIGDSLTWSQVYLSASEQRQAYKTYPDILGTLCGVESHLNATPGDTPILWWSRSSQGAFDHHGLYIVFLGTNGGLTDTISTDCVGTDPSTYANTNTGQYGRILQTIANNGDVAVLVSPWATGADLDVLHDVIEQFGERYSMPVIYITDETRTDINYHYYPDKSGSNSLHFNDLGYAWLANSIYEQINALSPSKLFKIMRKI